ncbi:MAG: PIN domain-containing protein [Treponemataceae bacterium]|nr:MAG: PIN domain-containing protein [Treponemataceae bacterium]
MQSEILIDAGPLIALFDRTDAYHAGIICFLKNKQYRFVSTVAVLTEVSHMLDFNVNAQLDFFEWVGINGVILHEIAQNDIPRIIALTKKYADLPMDFADATLVVAAEHTGIRQIISIDADFDIYRLPGKLKIKNVFEK